MSSTTAREPRNDKKRTDEAILETDAQFIQGLKVFSGDSESVSGLAGGNAQNSPQAPAGNYLAREGDSMIGPIALGPPVNFRVQIGTEENINISNLGDSPQYSSNIELDSVQPNGFVLDRIDGANFDGQILIMRTFGPDSFTISQATLANGGNIQTSTDEDLTLGPLQMIMLVFDEALVVFANTGGTWRVLSADDSGGGAGTGTFVSAALSVDQALNLAVTNHVEFDTDTPPTGANGGIILQTGAGQANGIFELKEGVTYFLTGAINPTLGATSIVEIAWYDITNAQEIGRRAQYDNNTNAASQKKAEIIFTPTTDVTVELRIFTVVGSFTQINALQSFASIFEFSGQTGPPGPAGSGVNWKEPARAKTTENVPNLAAFNVITDGITLVENDRVLLTEQTTLSENGLWQVGVVAAGLAPLTRPDDFDANDEVVSETFVPIEEGDVHREQLWHLTSDNPLTVDVSDQIWKQFGGAQTIGPDLGQDGDGFDGAGQFVFDGRIALTADKLKRWQRLDESSLPDGILGKLIYLPSVQASSFPNVDQFGTLLAGGLANSNVGAQQINIAYSLNFGETWIKSSGLDLNSNYELMDYDPVGSVVVAANTATGSTIPAQTIKRSTDRGVNFVATANTSAKAFDDLLWVAGSVNLFILIIFDAAANVQRIQTSPDGNTWTLRTTPDLFWRYLSYQEDTGTIYAFDTNANNYITSVDGINWSAAIPVTTPPASLFGAKKVIWSVGQQLFVSIRANGDLWSSPDADVWTLETTLPNVNAIRNFIWADDESLWIAIGQNSGNVSLTPLFWWSNDRINWTEGPNSWRENAQVRIGGSSNNADVVYAKEWGYFIGVGRANNQSTNITGRTYRTEVYMNGQVN